jgi:hypothetical protein
VRHPRRNFKEAISNLGQKCRRNIWTQDRHFEIIDDGYMRYTDDCSESQGDGWYLPGREQMRQGRQVFSQSIGAKPFSIVLLGKEIKFIVPSHFRIFVPPQIWQVSSIRL